LGNITSGGLNEDHTGIKVADPQLVRDASGLQRPGADSPARGAAQGNITKVTTDIDGQTRTGKWDVGCDQVSDAPVVNRPLDVKDVGPSWLPRTAGESAKKK
jgi:poly(beta-D-mannuronate) lyase